MKEFIEKNYKKIIIGLFLIGIILRLLNLNFLELWRDEAFSVNAANQDFVRMMEILISDTQPILHTVFLFFWVRIFGDSEFSVRFPSFVAGCITLYYIFKTSGLVFKRKSLRIAALALAVINPLLIVYSQEARSYSFLTLASIAAFYYCIKLSKESKLSDYFLFAYFSLLGLYSHNIFVVAFAVFVFITGVKFLKEYKPSEIFTIKNKYFLKTLLMFISIGVIYLPWVFIFISQLSKVQNQGFWLKFDPITDLINNSQWFFTSQSFNYNFTLLDKIAMPFIGLFGVLLALLGINKELNTSRVKTPFLTIAGVGMLALIFLISFKTPFFYIRYIIFVAPFVLLLAAKGTREFVRAAGYKAGVFVLVLFVTSTLIFYFENIAINYGSKSNTKGAIAAIEYNSDTDIILHPHTVTYHSYDYYTDIPSYVYDPNRTNAYYEGVAALSKENYYDGDLRNYSRIWTMNFWNDEGFNSTLKSNGFVKIKSEKFAGDLTLELWVLENTVREASFDLSDALQVNSGLNI